MKDLTNELKELYIKRFGEKFTKNLDPIQKLQIDFYKMEHHINSPSRCNLCYCFDKKMRQDLPFWLGNIQKDFMFIAQDAGKGYGDDFNSVFSIHTAYLDVIKYSQNKKHGNYLNYLKKLVFLEDNESENKFFFKIFLTDLVKCAFTTEKIMNINFQKNNDDKFYVKCHEDVFSEISAVKPKIIYLIGQKPRDSIKNLLSNKYKENKIKICFSFEVTINKRRKTSIQIFTHPAFKQIHFVSVPQLGNNRFSSECLNSLYNIIDTELKPRLKKYIINNNN